MQTSVDRKVLRSQIEPIEMSIKSIDSAKQFIKDHDDLLEKTESVGQDFIDKDKDKELENSKRKIPKIVSVTKVCSIM